MPFPQISRLMTTARRSITEYRYVLLISCCVAAIALGAQRMDMGLSNSSPSTATRPAVYQRTRTSGTDYSMTHPDEPRTQNRPEIEKVIHENHAQGWFVLPESIFGKPAKVPEVYQGHKSENTGDNQTMVHVWFEKLHKDLQLCENYLHSQELQGSGTSALNSFVIQLLLAGEMIDCLLERALSPRDQFEHCLDIHLLDFGFLNGYLNDPTKAQKRYRAISKALAKYYPPYATPEGDNTKVRRAVDLATGELPTQEKQDRLPSRYFIRQGKGNRKGNGKGKPLKSTSWRSHNCEDELCGEKDLAKDCFKDPSQWKSSMRSTCQMCYPIRDEDAIKKHCVKRRRREMEVLYVLCAVLITLIVTAAFLVILQDFRRRNRAPNRDTSQARLAKDWTLPLVKLPNLGWTTLKKPHRFWYPKFFQSIRRRRVPLDVEGDPAWFDADAYIRKQDDPQSQWHYLEEMQSIPRAIHKDITPDTLKFRKVGGRHAIIDEEMVPVMPPSRNSSVQLPPTTVDVALEGAFRNASGSDAAHRNQHFATVHARSPTERVTVSREMSRTLQ
ncbi:hypothetical protein FQN54_002030 [Arachnomyces sp. PD_36]|nr:hypothetical protein FQN54_002030 [Arachnomyces sp. PD_36]